MKAKDVKEKARQKKIKVKDIAVKKADKVKGGDLPTESISLNRLNR